MQNSSIEWTDRTWNPVSGCTKVSQGCKNCYAEKLHERFNGKGSFRTITTKPHKLGEPAQWKTPSRIFVNSMSDLFHEEVPFDFIIQVFLKMIYTPRHTYQVLTKRAARALAFFQMLQGSDSMLASTIATSKNIWIGVSVEDQAAADERIPLLLQMPVAVRFLSCEPLLGPVDFENRFSFRNLIHWVIAGGESGHGARPMHPDWARSLRDQCAAAGVAFFFKQWGKYIEHEMYVQQGFVKLNAKGSVEMKGPASKGVIKAHGDNYYYPVSKKDAGRLLDGKEHSEFPNT